VSATEGTLAEVLAGSADWCVVEGDCLEVLPTIPDKAVAHVITDPPYSPWVHAQEKKAGKRRDGSDRLSAIDFDSLTPESMRLYAGQLARVCERWCLVFSDAESNAAWRDALASLRHIRVGSWIKPDASPQFSGDRPSAAFELIQISHGASRCRWNGGGTHGVWRHGVEHVERLHATPKPVPLMLELVSLFTDPGELVLDAFAGSGTTGVACLRLGRRFIGIERDPKYAAVARERLRAEANGLSLRDARAGQLPMFGAP
jgi:site-specific DNA-methyltransferase (adenine-specific)